MAGICLAAGLIVATLPLHSFTLAWTHSIEKIRWEEDYRIVDRRLVLEEARIRGSGAGMEPPPDAVLKNGIWSYRPTLAPLGALRLSHSPYAAGYTLCSDGRCRPLAEILTGIADTETVVIAPCSP
ncbi:MAG: DUF1850 domain-containing protein [Sterolibacterium sp.]|jgi:hypothetical protein